MREQCPPKRVNKTANKLSRDIFGAEVDDLDQEMKEMLDQFKRPVLPGKTFGLYNKQEKDQDGILISQNNCFLNVVLQLLWNIDKIQEFLIDFSHSENEKDNELIQNLKLFINQVERLNESEFQNSDNPIDFDILSIRLALDRCYGDTGQFGVNEKGDAPETFEAIVYQINDNLMKHKPKLAKRLRRLVNIGAGGIDRESTDGISANYISAEDLIDGAPDEIYKIKGKLSKYLTKYYKSQKTENSSDDSKDSDSEESKTTEDTLKPPKLHMLNISWLTNSSEKIYKFLSMIPNKIKFSKLGEAYNSSKDYTYYFKCLTVYWGSHYFLFMRKDDSWVQLNDTYIKIEPSWTAIVEDSIRGKILPIMLGFERCDTKAEKKIARKVLTLEDDYLTSVLNPLTPKKTMQRIHDEEAWICDTGDEVNNGLLVQCSKCTVHKPQNARKADYGFEEAADGIPVVGENEWVGEKCTTINPISKYVGGICGYKNLVIKHLIIQQRIANAGYSKYCNVCKDFYRGHGCPQCEENALIYNGVYNSVSNNNGFY